MNPGRWRVGAPARLGKLVNGDLDGIALEFPSWEDPLGIDFDPPGPVDAGDMEAHQAAAAAEDAQRLATELDDLDPEMIGRRSLSSTLTRQAFLAKFNPADDLRYGPRFVQHDVEADFPWHAPPAAAAGGGGWLSADILPSTARQLATLQQDDLVFMQRSFPKTADGPRPEHGAQARRRLVGVTFVRSLHRRWDATRRRDATSAILVPLARFSRAVDVKTMLTRRRMSAIDVAVAFRDLQRRTLLPLEALEADLLADACTLPRAALSHPDVARLAAELGYQCPGMRPSDAAYLDDAVARNTVRRAHEQRAVQAVERFLQARGWSVGRYPERTKGAGADLDLWHPDLGDDPGDWRERVLVEVEGYQTSNPRAVWLQQAQYDHACDRADRAEDDRWRLVVVLDVEAPNPIVHVWSPTQVRDHWPHDRVH